MGHSREFFVFAALCSLRFGRDDAHPDLRIDALSLAGNARKTASHCCRTNGVPSCACGRTTSTPFVTFIAALGAYVIAKRHDPGFALLGIVFIGLWAFSEALQQALSIVALNWTWRGTYLAARSATRRPDRNDRRRLPGSRIAVHAATRCSMPCRDGLCFLLLSATSVLGASCFMVAALLRRARRRSWC